MIRLCILLSVVFFSVYQTEQAYFLEQDYIDQINKEATTWKAGNNFDPRTTKESLTKLLEFREIESAMTAKPSEIKTHDRMYNKIFKKIPAKFDAREEWKNCQTIGMVRDQGNCASAWAISTSSAFSDRLCIATNGEFNQLLSVQELLFCCPNCGLGCYGGYPIKAWQYFRNYGLVTGGEYDSEEGCEPYRVPPCSFDELGNATCIDESLDKNHQCIQMCYGEEDIDYEKDHKFTRDFYYLTYRIIQQDMMTYGPVAGVMNVYDDFLSYKSGVYIKSKNATFLGTHSVKLIGWGEENGVPYWLAVPSWSYRWGDKGIFKVRRGTSEYGIDNSTTAGVPVKY